LRGVKVGAGCFYPDKGWYMPRTAEEAANFEGDKAAFMRSHAGSDAWLMMDGHMGNNATTTWSLDIATAVMRAVEPANLFFFEEPLHYTDPFGYAELCRRSKAPIAGGECLTASCEWKTFIEQNCFDIGQPDASFNGGVVEFMRVAGMLRNRGRRLATHAWGAGGCFMQNLHCGFAADNTAILEIPPDFAGLHSEIIDGGFRLRDGYAIPPDRPGLGIVLTDETRRRYPFKPGSGEFNSVPGKQLLE
jgi:L-alanine-DL-glutamate epimerase-like enolase superfamily enzyme